MNISGEVCSNYGTRLRLIAHEDRRITCGLGHTTQYLKHQAGNHFDDINEVRKVPRGKASLVWIREDEAEINYKI